MPLDQNEGQNLEQTSYQLLGVTQKQQRLKELAFVFLKLGTIAFGGSAAHIAPMDDEVVSGLVNDCDRASLQNQLCLADTCRRIGRIFGSQATALKTYSLVDRLRCRKAAAPTFR